jgi:outer membrane biosynthesis protein TonB
MAKYKTNEVIKSELEALSVGYDDDMTNAELQALLDEATDAPEEKKEPEAQPKKKAPEEKKEPEAQPKKKAPEAQAPEVTNGVGTINDHEKRIFALEQKGKK